MNFGPDWLGGSYSPPNPPPLPPSLSFPQVKSSMIWTWPLQLNGNRWVNCLNWSRWVLSIFLILHLFNLWKLISFPHVKQWMKGAKDHYYRHMATMTHLTFRNCRSDLLSQVLRRAKDHYGEHMAASIKHIAGWIRSDGLWYCMKWVFEFSDLAM